MAEVPVVT